MAEKSYKSGFATLIGRPNVGKSTLMNHLIGQKIAITSNKPQTTRNRIQTVYTSEEGQIVFVDTPGIHKAKNRAAADVRSTLTKGNGSLATTGSVSFNFERKGQIVVPAEGVDFDNLFEKAAEAGAEDVTDDGEVFTVITDPSDMIDVRKALQDAGFDYDSADLVMMPKNEVELSLEDAQKVSKLIDNLDDLDDVQNIYSNWTASDEVMAQLDEE